MGSNVRLLLHLATQAPLQGIFPLPHVGAVNQCRFEVTLPLALPLSTVLGGEGERMNDGVGLSGLSGGSPAVGEPS